MLHLFLLALVTTSTTENIANARQLGLLSVAHQSQSAPSPVVTPPVVNSCLLAFRALILFAFFLILALVCLYWRNHRVFVLRVEQELERRHKKPAVILTIQKTKNATKCTNSTSNTKQKYANTTHGHILTYTLHITRSCMHTDIAIANRCSTI
eukprot:c788_g1_i1.p1 GENE.c788_g1_i1~~c788_g1_i1.p1  ORF type:complete len:153 (+),score=20.04 c788_g1_i1:44-502(+)